MGWRQAAIQTYAYNADIQRWMLANGIYPFEHVIRYITYPFVHASFTHAAFAGVILLAMGKFVGEVFRQWAVAAVFAGSAIFGESL